MNKKNTSSSRVRQYRFQIVKPKILWPHLHPELRRVAWPQALLWRVLQR